MMFGMESGLEDQEWVKELLMNELARQCRELKNRVNFLERENLRLAKQVVDLWSENSQLLRQLSDASRKEMAAHLKSQGSRL